jgi:hypothetical protein
MRTLQVKAGYVRPRKVCRPLRPPLWWGRSVGGSEFAAQVCDQGMEPLVAPYETA